MNEINLFNRSRVAVLIIFSLAACGLDPSAKIFNAAELHLSRGEYREAIEAHTELIDKYPESPLAPESLFKKGRIYYRYLNDKEKALKAYYELAYLYPKSARLADAAMDKGAIYSSLGEHWKAVEEYEWLIERAGDDNVDSYRYLVGMEYFKMNDFRQARIEFTEIIQKNMESLLAPDIQFRIAASFYLEGRLDESLAAYRLVIKLFEDHQLALESSVNIARIHADAGRLNEALEVLRILKTNSALQDHEFIDIRIALIEERMKKPGQKGKKRRR